jgi:hypothetical protein
MSVVINLERKEKSSSSGRAIVIQHAFEPDGGMHQSFGGSHVQ